MAKINYSRLVSLLAAVLVLSTTGCTHTFPSQVTDRVDKNISFSDLIRDPGAYKGKVVMLAGSIVGARTEKDGTYLEIIQTPADRSGEPRRTDETGGRFIAVSKQFLDPAVYATGRRITVVGEVIGDSVKPLGAMTYRYPLVGIDADHLWEPSYGPRYHVGFGLGVMHRF